MVSLVIVSHSRALANALYQLIEQVTPESVPIAIAAGVGPEHSEFGTDAIEIMEAIQSVYSTDGVLVMMDLGSAVLSSQMAVDLLPPEMAENIRFCGAPLVEGSIAASVRIGLGNDLQTVYIEALQALMPKNEQLGISAETFPVESGAVPESANSSEAALQVVVTLKNLHGLHARPAARFIKKASSFKSTIQVINQTTGKGPVSAKSLNALATLGAVQNHQIVILATGEDAARALAELSAMVEDGFGELETGAVVALPPNEPASAIAASRSPIAGNQMQGIPVSEGFALGPIYHYALATPVIPQEKIDAVETELERLQNAIDRVAIDIQQQQKKMLSVVGKEQAAIFDAHLLILLDPDIQNRVRQLIGQQKDNASLAWSSIIRQVADTYRNLPDDYMRQRAMDVMDVGNQVLQKLSGESEKASVQFEQPVILFAEEITPTETSRLDMEQVLAIVTVSGGPTSHAAILARALGIPAISGADPNLGKIKPDTMLAVDGFKGTLWINPNADLQADLTEQRKAWLNRRQQLLLSSHEQAKLKDGQRIEVAANIGNVVDARAAVKNGAEGVGLLRTEFLFLTRQTPPTEEEQYEALCQIGEAMENRPIIVRTLDVGGDKELPYINVPMEENPFLGVRAIRLCFQQTDIFISQLRAILRAGASYPFRIMFPMIARLDEILLARQWVEKAHQQLLAEKISHCWPIETGIMVEIPSAAVLSHVLAPHVDFFSIGTNDLTQYTMAAERGNPALADLTDALNPAVLQLIQKVVEAAHNRGKWVGVCGELAGDPVAAPVLIGLGVDELSMNPSSIPRVKDLLRKMDRSMIETLSAAVMAAETAPAARKTAREYLQNLGLL